MWAKKKSTSAASTTLQITRPRRTGKLRRRCPKSHWRYAPILSGLSALSHGDVLSDHHMVLARGEIFVQLDDNLVEQLDALAAGLGTNRSGTRPVRTSTRCRDRTCLVARNDTYWADLGPPGGRRPDCVLTRDAAIEVLPSVTCAPITRTIRGIRSEVGLGVEHGLPETSVINCDNVITIPLADLDGQPVGHFDEITRARLDEALRYSLDIVY
ncbi:MAG: mRNA interferase MazF [Ilumatobacter sp.]|jgi:mRNA interferase MazF